MERISAPGFQPNFFSEHSVVLNHPISQVFPIIGTFAGQERVARLSELSSGFELHETDTVGISRDVLLENASVRTISPHDAQSEGGDSVRQLPRLFFTLHETVPIFFGLFQKHVSISGTLTWDEEANVSLYESKTNSSIAVTVWKLRKFEELEGNKTRVTETIKGLSPGWVRNIVESQTQSGHVAHMDSYHKLF